MDFQTLAQYAVEHRASDIHLSPNLPPMIRVDGDMKEVRVAPLSAEEIKKILDSMMSESQRVEYEKELELDFMCMVGAGLRYRVNAYTTLNGPTAAFREIPVKIKTLEELGTPAIFEKLTELGKGLVLVTGPTGSGKSTTLAAMVNHINMNDNRHIITIEDPVEFVHKSHKSLVNQREVGSNTKSFARALKSALREDPDVILIGELRDLESISLALTAAETGHLVFGTLHTSSAPKTVDRIIDVFPGEDKPMVRAMLASSLQAVISQRLFKRKDGIGRVAVHEIMVSTHAVSNLIRENKIPQIKSMIQVGSQHGMALMEDKVKSLIAEGVIDYSEAAEVFDTEEAEKQSRQKAMGHMHVYESDKAKGNENDAARTEKKNDNYEEF